MYYCISSIFCCMKQVLDLLPVANDVTLAIVKPNSHLWEFLKYLKIALSFFLVRCTSEHIFKRFINKVNGDM